jgi:hypothetical protein
VEYYTKVLVAVAEYQARQPGGDWAHAREYLERVVASPAPGPDDGLDSEFKDSAEDDREIDVEEPKVLYGDTAGDRSELAVL